MDSSRTKEKERISVLKRHHKTKTIPEWLWNKCRTVFQCRRQNPNLKSTESLCKDLEFGVASWSPVSVQIPLRLKTVNAKGASAIINYCLNDYILYKISFPSIFPCFQIYLWKYIIITITFFGGGECSQKVMFYFVQTSQYFVFFYYYYYWYLSVSYYYTVRILCKYVILLKVIWVRIYSQW